MSRTARRVVPWLALAGSVAVLAAAGTAARAGGAARPAGDGQQEEPFPHEEHAGLFPYCTGCHREVASEERSARFPDPDLCVRCHDGVDRSRVDWELRRPEANNLRFSHAEHPVDTVADGREIVCTTCHTAEGETRMATVRSSPDLCLGCHEHEAEGHYANASCGTCHDPLAESGLPRARIAELPETESHEGAAFLSEGHGEMAEVGTASCATCHARERCTSCHVDAGRVAQIGRMPAAGGRLELPVYEASYPTPESHESSMWLEQHGGRAGRADCSACHTRESCTSCHSGAAPEVVGRLASADEVSAPGVDTERQAPASHAAPTFVEGHGAVAAADPASCQSCHSEPTCVECHAGEGPSRFHPPNFVAQHSAAAYSGRMECANCHNAEAFCRKCHSQLGMETRGQLGGAFHDGQSFWLFQHGQAARRNLQSCRTCHAQRDCLQCHSQTGAFQVNPHGSSFDPERAHSRNPQICFACHLSDPLRGGTP